MADCPICGAPAADIALVAVHPHPRGAVHDYVCHRCQYVTDLIVPNPS